MGHTDSGRQKVNGGFERKGEGRGKVVEEEEQKGGEGVEEWRRHGDGERESEYVLQALAKLTGKKN